MTETLPLPRDLEFDPQECSALELYRLIGSLVVPRPIAWISTVSPDGHHNLAPYSYFTAVADRPPHVAFSSIGEKDTLRNIRAGREFVVNIADQVLLGALDRTGAALAPDVDEFTETGMTATPSARVAAPRVGQAPAALECVLVSEHDIGNGVLVVGRVVYAHVRPAVWRHGRADSALLDPVLRLSGCYGSLSPAVTAEEEPAPHALP